MRITFLLPSLLWSAFLITQGIAQNSTNSAGTLPQCAAVCLVSTISQSPCAVTNQTCICTDPFIARNAPICISQKCTIKESLVAKNFTERTCNNPIRSKQWRYRAITNVLGSISAPLVAIRLVTKWWIFGELGWDDYTIAITTGAGIPSTVLTTYGLLSNGLGLDIWTVTPKQITSFVHIFYIMEILYFAQLALLKLSLLLFYLRIFPGPGIRKLIWGSIIFDVLFGLVFVLAATVQCQPISYYWKNWDGQHQGRCFNINAMAFANAAISIVFDGWMLALPMSQIIHLKMHWRKKIGVAAMLLVGTFVTVVSILRLQALVQFANSQNPTFDNTATGEWSTIEINVGIICACMPSMRLLLLHIFPNVRGVINKSSQNSYPSNRSNGSRDKSRKVGGSQVGSDGIKLHKSFTVKFGSQRTGTEEDETSLVPMNDLEAARSNSKPKTKDDNV